MENGVFENSLKAIDTASLVDKVENSLVELLQQQNLQVGDSIPKEIELVALLGVSRTVIREALARLRTMGLIESKKKKGSGNYQPRHFRCHEQKHESAHPRPGNFETNFRNKIGA